jgi:cystathionine beta-synthase
MIITHISEAIGSTPLLHIPINFGKSHLYIKLEYLNPCGSMKDRMALNMLTDLAHRHDLTHGALIVESSSGNTAGALAMLSAERDIRFKAIVDHHAAVDKIRMIEAFGAEIEYVDSAGGMLSTAKRDRRARELSLSEDNCFWTEQHNNPANAGGYVKLADELMNDLDGKLDIFVSAIGTGGSLCGTASALKRHLPNLLTVGVEPDGSIIFGGKGKPYHQSGTGTPEGAEVGLVIDYEQIDEGRKVGDLEAFAMCRVLAKRFGLLVGGSSGGAIFEAVRKARFSPEGTRVAVLACDAGSKYLDTIFNGVWLEERGLDTAAREEEIIGWFPRSTPSRQQYAA